MTASGLAPDVVGLVRDLIRDVPDFPQPGVMFKDITPLLAHPVAFGACVDALAAAFADQQVDKVVGIEARGFIVAAPVALALGAGFVPVRKPGKLPWRVRSQTYQLEYGTDTLEITEDGLAPGERVLVVDDVLATGGTGRATLSLVEALGARAVGVGCLMELSFLGGRQRLADVPTVALVEYD